MTGFGLDEIIVSKFGIEKSSPEYEKAYNLCLDETILFILQNTSKERADAMSRRLDSEDPSAVFSDFISQIPYGHTRLRARLKYFLNGLLIQNAGRNAGDRTN